MLPPAQAGFGNIHQASDAHVAGQANTSLSKQVLEVAHSRDETIGEGRHMQYASTLCRLVHLHCLDVVHAQLLFDKHMLASSSGGKRNGSMQNGWGSNDNCIDARMVQQVVIVGEGGSDAVFLGAL